MNIKTILNLFHIKKLHGPQLPVSIVLLLGAGGEPSEGRLCLAAQRAWNISFKENESSPHFVMQCGSRGIVKAGAHLLATIYCRQPYFSKGTRAYAKAFPLSSQRQGWPDHVAWLSIDYMKSHGDEELEYCVVAAFAAEMLDSHCSGVYIPKEGSFIPNSDSLYDKLRSIALLRDPDIN